MTTTTYLPTTRGFWINGVSAAGYQTSEWIDTAVAATLASGVRWTAATTTEG